MNNNKPQNRRNTNAAGATRGRTQQNGQTANRSAVKPTRSTASKASRPTDRSAERPTGRPAIKQTGRPDARPATAKPASNGAAEGVRLQKFLADHGVASRRAAEQIITEGRVTVNGRTVTELGTRIDPRRDRVCVDKTRISGHVEMRYIMLNKPTGYICTASDDRGRRTVLDLLDGVNERIYPVGRLDYDTAGLLLLTNDGELTHHLLHPSHQVNKTYLAEVEGHLSNDELNRLRRGVRLSDGMTAPASAAVVRRGEHSCHVELTIHEGRNRQVRRMMDAVGHPVIRLKRTRLAFLDARELSIGEWRELSAAEVEQLRRL